MPSWLSDLLSAALSSKWSPTSVPTPPNARSSRPLHGRLHASRCHRAESPPAAGRGAGRLRAPRVLHVGTDTFLRVTPTACNCGILLLSPGLQQPGQPGPQCWQGLFLKPSSGALWETEARPGPCWRSHLRSSEVTLPYPAGSQTSRRASPCPDSIALTSYLWKTSFVSPGVFLRLSWACAQCS